MFCGLLTIHKIRRPYCVFGAIDRIGTGVTGGSGPPYIEVIMAIEKISAKMNKVRIFLSLIACLVLSTGPVGMQSALAVDVTDRVVCLGQPFQGGAFARNVWDMQVFDGRVYIGSGNYLNNGPSANAGPVPVICYNPQTGQFVKEFSVDEEQIDIFKIIDGRLVIPGTDARESWEYGNYYVLDNGRWQKKRTIPGAVHVFDLASYQGRLYAAIERNNNQFVASSDGGRTWTPQVPSPGCFNCLGAQRRTLFEFNGRLYGTGALSPGSTSTEANNVLVVDASGSTVHKMPNLLPGRRSGFQMILRPCTVGGSLLYLGVFNNTDGSQWMPDGLYAASDIERPWRVALPDGGALPADILVRGNTAYVLAFYGSARNGYTNIVYRSEDLKKWTEMFRFHADTFARSFEELNGDFYFGLGCRAYPLSDSSGSILRVGRGAYQ